MTKTIPTTIGVLIIVLIAGVAGASVLLFNQDAEEEIDAEKHLTAEKDKAADINEEGTIEEAYEEDLEIEGDEEGFGKDLDEKKKDIPKTEEMGRYKKTSSFSFDYTKEETDFFKKGSHYNVYKGGEDSICILSFEGRILCFNSGGNIVSDFNSRFSQSDCGTRGMVNNRENIYIVCNRELHRYSLSGVKKEKIELSQKLKEADILLKLYISRGNIFYYDVSGESYLLAEIEDEGLRETDFSANKGILGEITGNWYDFEILERWVSGKIEVMNSSKERIFDKKLEVDGIVGIHFLGEDEDDNFYIGFEVVKEDSVGTIVNIYKFDGISGKYRVLEKDEECGAILSDNTLTLWKVVNEEELREWRVVECEWK